MKHFPHKLLALLLLFAYPLHAENIEAEELPEWTVMIYAEADSILNNFAAKNFYSMSTIGSNKRLNIVVQWNQPKKTGTWRYKIEKNKMKLVDSGGKSLRPDFTQDLINFADFSVKTYPAQKYALILWNHGLGILDPKWSHLQYFSVSPTVLGRNSRIQIAGLTSPLEEEIKTACSLDEFGENGHKRGILFDIANKKYLDNQGLAHALDYITKNITQKKLDLIGMDACLMSMLEVHYQIKDYALFAVTSEEVELARGWNYTPFLEALSTTSLSPEQLAESIVYSFEDFYKEKTKLYTQSAVDLHGVEALKENLDEIISNILICKQKDERKTLAAVKAARRLCFELSIPCYVDLYSFYSELQTKLKKKKANEPEEFEELRNSLNKGMQLIDNIVIANVASDYLCQAKGISIYYPQKDIDPSYYSTLFVQDSMWLPFLHQATR